MSQAGSKLTYLQGREPAAHSGRFVFSLPV
jgi:hypothetical protein